NVPPSADSGAPPSTEVSGSSAPAPGGADRSRVGGSRRGADELEHHVVDVAVEPVLAWLVRPNERVPGAVEMGGGVASGRVVAAAHVPTGLTDAQVHPVAAPCGQAVLAPRSSGLGVDDLVQVLAGLLRHGRSSRPLRSTPRSLARRTLSRVHRYPPGRVRPVRGSV